MISEITKKYSYSMALNRYPNLSIKQALPFNQDWFFYIILQNHHTCSCLCPFHGTCCALSPYSPTCFPPSTSFLQPPFPPPPDVFPLGELQPSAVATSLQPNPFANIIFTFTILYCKIHTPTWNASICFLRSPTPLIIKPRTKNRCAFCIKRSDLG